MSTPKAPTSARVGHLVRLRMEATGETWSQALPHLNGPDLRHVLPEPTAPQASFEADVVAELADIYGSHAPALGHLPFGILSVTPYSDHLVVRLDRADTQTWARALLSGALPSLRWREQSKGVCLYPVGTAARIVLARIFPKQWAAAAAAVRRNSAPRVPALSTSTHAHEASSWLRRIALTCPERDGDTTVHVGVGADDDGEPRLLDLVRPAAMPALTRLRDAMPPGLQPGAPLPDTDEEAHWRVVDRLVRATGSAAGSARPAPGVTWHETLCALARVGNQLSAHERAALHRRHIPYWGAGTLPAAWWGMYERLRRWVGEHGQQVPRDLVADGQPLGEWLWENLHSPEFEGELSVAGLLELVGDYGSTMPCIPAKASTPNLALQKVERADLDTLLALDERRCRSDRAPSVTRASGPEPGHGLILEVTLGYQDARFAATLTCAGDHTWEHLAAAIDRLYARDDEHLAAFFYNSRTWRIGKDAYPDQRFERIPIDFPRSKPSPAVSFTPGGIPDYDTPLSALLAPGYSVGYLFDFGDKWLHTLRVLRWTHPDEDAQLRNAETPLVGVRPAMGPPSQYYPEDAPGWGHYLALPSLAQVRPVEHPDSSGTGRQRG